MSRANFNLKILRLGKLEAVYDRDLPHSSSLQGMLDT